MSGKQFVGILGFVASDLAKLVEQAPFVSLARAAPIAAATRKFGTIPNVLDQALASGQCWASRIRSHRSGVAPMPDSMKRRDFLHRAGAIGALSLIPGATRLHASDILSLSEELVPTRKITKGPKHHWFGYYDKLEFDPSNRFVLSNEVDFEMRTPTAEDEIRVGMVDTQDGDRWIELGRSKAWGWQQGCMLQWLPGTESKVIWNDREQDRFVSRIQDVQTGETQVIPHPIYSIGGDGKWAVSTSFARVQNMRPGYGYKGIKDPYEDERHPARSGIWNVNLETGSSELIVSLDTLAGIPFEGAKLHDRWSWTNHLLMSPDSKRFVFLHRWREFSHKDERFETNRGWKTRMFVANVDGSDLRLLMPHGMVSHFIWKDPDHVCAWTQPEGEEAGFYVYNVHSLEYTRVGAEKMPRDGHNTYLPFGNGVDWILNDAYPTKDKRQQIPYLYHVPTDRRFDIGKFHLPPDYKGEWRCDLHPRASNDGRIVAIDSAHGGDGRQVYLLDVSAIVVA